MLAFGALCGRHLDNRSSRFQRVRNSYVDVCIMNASLPENPAHPPFSVVPRCVYRTTDMESQTTTASRAAGPSQGSAASAVITHRNSMLLVPNVRLAALIRGDSGVCVMRQIRQPVRSVEKRRYLPCYCRSLGRPSQTNPLGHSHVSSSDGLSRHSHAVPMDFGLQSKIRGSGVASHLSCRVRCAAIFATTTEHHLEFPTVDVADSLLLCRAGHYMVIGQKLKTKAKAIFASH